MIRVIGLAAAGLALVACAAAEPEPVVDVGTPEQRVADWLVALDGLDLGGLADTTDPVRVALIAGAENELTSNQLFAVIDSGLPGPTAQSYWSSFRSSFVTFLGADVSAITIGDVERFEVGDLQFAAVEVQQGDAEAKVMTVLTGDGWRVDLVGTSGSALAARLTELVARIVEDAEGDTIDPAARYRSAAIGSLRAALTLRPDDRTLQLEIDAIESLPRPTA